LITAMVVCAALIIIFRPQIESLFRKRQQREQTPGEEDKPSVS
jgi:hypothetical protein